MADNPEGKEPATPVRLSDEAFVDAYHKCKQNCVATGRELGISHVAVLKRVKKLAALVKARKPPPSRRTKEHAVKSKEAGRAAGALIRIKPADPAAFNAGVVETEQKMQAADKLEEMFEEIASLLGHVKDQIAKATENNKPLKPFHIDQVCKLVDQQRRLVAESHKIKLDLINAKALELYIGAVNRIIARQEPHVQLQLYAELSNIGIEGQASITT